ncbi:MAG: transcription-repair coupling factor, partial [Cryobacterium sp.]|nr:transcription-repair coupling factor [Cryobacterium sp.]
MTLEGLSARLLHASSFAAAVESGAKGSLDFSVVDGLRAPLLAGLLGRRAVLEPGRASALFVIVATSRDSELLREALASLVPEAEILDFPSWETLPHERLSPSSESVGSRLHTLRRLKSWEADRSRPIIVVASVRAALQPLAAGLVDTELLTLKTGSRGHDLSELGRELVDLAYQRVDMVTRRGEFAVRGGILDVFPPTAEHPIRADFFGDEIEELRGFSVTDQRSFGEPLAEVELPPSRELLLTESVRQRARELRHEFPNLGAMLEKIAEGIPVEGMESLGPALADRFVPVTEYLPKDAAIAVVSPERVATRAVSLGETNREFLVAAWSAATAGAEAPVDLSASFQQQLEVGDFLSVNELRAAAGERDWWTLSGFDSGQIDDENAEALPGSGTDPGAGVARRPEMVSASSSTA